MHRRRPLCLLAALAIALLAPPAAVAGPPGTWDRMSPANGRNIDEPGMARTADGVLHVLYDRHLGGLHEAITQVRVSPSGKVAASSTVSGGWSILDAPGVVTGADGHSLHAFWGGQLGDDANHQELNYAYSTDGGATWTLAPYNLLTGEQVGMDTLSAARLGSTIYQTWGSWLHLGTAAGPGRHFTASPRDDCCGYWANVAANEARHQVVVAWSSNQDGHEGAYAQFADPATGAPIGSPVRMPASATKYAGSYQSDMQLARVPLASQVGKDRWRIFMAYPSGYPAAHAVAVWRVGGPSAWSVLRDHQRIGEVGLAAGPDGRMWAFWSEHHGAADRLYARRSNPTVTRWGATVRVPLPRHTSDVWKVAGEGTLGPLDLVPSLQVSGKIAFWHTRVLPGLTLRARPGRLHRCRTTVTFTVEDAGAPVAGAKVKAGGKSDTTDASGHATLKLGPFGRHAKRVWAVASKGGYASGRLRLRVTK